jgi:hypothetical protein
MIKLTLFTNKVNLGVKMKRITVLISIVLTLFVLGVGAGVGKAILTPQTSGADTQAMQATLDAMQTQYAQTVADANQRIEAANAALASAQYASLEVTAAPLSTDQIINLALMAAGEGEYVASTPQLVSYSGVTAYEVLLTDGNVLYLSADTGALLYNSLTGTADPVITREQASQAALTYFGGGQIYAVDRGTLGSSPVYRVIMTSGSMAFINLRGQVVYVQLAQAQAVPQVSTGAGTSQPVSGDDDGDDHD